MDRAMGSSSSAPRGGELSMFAVLPTLKQHAQAGWLQRSFLQIFPVCLEGTLRETPDL